MVSGSMAQANKSNKKTSFHTCWVWKLVFVICFSGEKTVTD